jgi:hypothetical protein
MYGNNVEFMVETNSCCVYIIMHILTLMCILLHVWGSLGSVTLALLQQCSSTTLLRSLDTQQYWTALASLAGNNVNKHHCYVCNNRQAFPRSQDCCLWTSTDIGVFWNSLECRRVCIWLRTPFGWKTEFVSGKSERSMWLYTVDDEDIWSSGLMQVNDGLYAEVPLWCASGTIAHRWIVPTCVWKLSDCKNGSECWKIATRRIGRIL